MILLLSHWREGVLLAKEGAICRISNLQHNEFYLQEIIGYIEILEKQQLDRFLAEILFSSDSTVEGTKSDAECLKSGEWISIITGECIVIDTTELHDHFFFI